MSRDILDLVPPPADARLPYGDDPWQFGDLRVPGGPGPHPVVVVVHGGFWREAYSLDYISHMCAALTAEGLATWNIEYRRLGPQGGGWPGTFHDVASALEHLRQIADRHDLDLTRVVPVGHSAGGHLALWLAARRRIPAGDPLYSPTPLRVHGAVSLAGVVDLRMAWELHLSNGVVEQFLGGTPATVPERYATGSPRDLLPLGVPQTLIHGTADESVPYAISREYADAAGACGDDAQLITLQGIGHFEVVDPRSSVWPWVLETILALLE